VSENRPRIGVTRWEDIPADRFYAYCERLTEAGAEPVELSTGTSNVAGLNGLVVTGGIDVCPETYGEKRHPKVKHTDTARDRFELAALDASLKAGLPVLAVCRGHQLLNVAMGGTLLQHIESGEHRAHFELPDVPSRWHTLLLEPGSRLHSVFGADEIEVNSRHHQAVTPATIATALKPVAFSPDGLIEGIESREHPWVVGVQWHPELPEAEHPHFRPRFRPLFAALAEAARLVRETV
jgi:putative glutamine amidotransferase